MRFYINGKRYKLNPKTMLFFQGLALIILGKICLITKETGAAVFLITYGVLAVLGK